MSHDQFSTQIQKTGFVLENQIAQQLRAEKWTVISNRYYVDDAEESVREIDLVAYKATRTQHFDVYTTLLISCKKSEANAWALLSRNIDLKDPNSDWQPVHAWSNDKALAFQLFKPDSAKLYHDAVAALGVTDVLSTPNVEVFAFQEMNKVSGAPQNDKAIFSAITSLMKAQAYELGALPQRKRTPVVYQFNLVSIVDTELVRLMFVGQKIKAASIDHEQYIARYIIKKRATFSRIRFMRSNVFSNLLPQYSALHKANCAWFDAECNSFYFDIVKDRKRVVILIEDFRKEIQWPLRMALIGAKHTVPNLDKLDLYWSEPDSSIYIYAPISQEAVDALNEDQKLREKVGAALAKFYRYKGSFKFEEEIPF